MVLLRGPSLAAAAQGGLGKSLIFAQTKGRAYLKRWHKPANPKTVAQTAIRAATAFCSSQWSALSAAQKLSWESLPEADASSPFHAYLAFNIAAARDNLRPTKAYPTTRYISGGGVSGFTAVAQGRRPYLTFTATSATNSWGMIIYHSATTPFSATWQTAWLLIPTAASATYHTLGPVLSAGWHYFKISPFSKDGKESVYLLPASCYIA